MCAPDGVPTMSQLAASDLFARSTDIVFHLRKPIPAWMTQHDNPWEYLTPALALDSSGGKR